MSSKRTKCTTNQFLNNASGASRPPADIFVGDVTHTASYATRTGPDAAFTYDARIVQTPTVSADDAETFQRSLLSSHACRALVKGILMGAPHLIAAKTELKLVEAMLQVSPQARAIGKANLLRLLSQVPLGRITSALSMILNHDGDLERAHNAEWWAWRVSKKELGGDPAARRARFLRTQWCRKASMAVSLTAKANETRAKMSRRQRSDVPDIQVTETVSGDVVTQGHVARIHEVA